MNSSEEWSLCMVKTQPQFPLGLVKGMGTVFTCCWCPALPSPVWCVLCLLPGVDDLSWVFLGSCCAGTQKVTLQPVPGAAPGVHASHPKGCLSPGIAGMGPQGPIRAATGSWWRVPWSWRLTVTVCSYLGDPFWGAEKQHFSNPYLRAVPAALCWEGSQIKKTLITATPQMIKSAKYLCIVTKQGWDYTSHKT